MKIVGIVPSINHSRNECNIKLDVNLINFLSIIFKKSDFQILSKKKINKYDLIVLSGGNTIKKISRKKEDLIRNSLDNYYLNYSIKNKIPIIGICHGAQFLASSFESEINKKKGHVRKYHTIFLNSKKTVKVNSFHNYSITKLSNNFIKLAWTKDGSIEAFKHKKYKMLGIMWHPERNSKIKKFDLDFIKKFL